MHRKRPLLEKPRIDMNPMIDVVFLLLAFFVLTFKIIVPEGDFNIQMSAAGQVLGVEIETDSVQIRLRADENGLLSGIQLNGDPIENYELLRQRVSAISQSKPDLEAVLYCDEHLHYEYVIKAITAVNGEWHEGQIRKICANIRF
ncbi:MAG: biopolymer transporter ExbD, partial [Planctomycetaceae bacterium]|nr:biopolymer transporter ExbD [Planctomycetaceae bacterium]